MYVIVVHFTVASERAEAMAARCAQQAADSLAKEPGCHRFDVCVDAEDPSKILLYEFYDDPAAFDAHLASDHFAQFNAQVAPWTEAKRVETFYLRAPIA